MSRMKERQNSPAWLRLCVAALAALVVSIFWTSGSVSAVGAEAEKTPPALERQIAQGSALDARSMYADAAHVFTRAVSTFPNEPRAHYWLGLVSFHAASYTQAVEELSRAIELDSGFKDAYMIRARVLNETKDFDRTLRDLDRVTEFDPGFKEAFEYKADIYEELKNKPAEKEARARAALLSARAHCRGRAVRCRFQRVYGEAPGPGDEIMARARSKGTRQGDCGMEDPPRPQRLRHQGSGVEQYS